MDETRATARHSTVGAKAEPMAVTKTPDDKQSEPAAATAVEEEPAEKAAPTVESSATKPRQPTREKTVASLNSTMDRTMSGAGNRTLTLSERGRLGLAPLPPPSTSRSRRDDTSRGGGPVLPDQQKPGCLLPLLTPRRRPQTTPAAQARSPSPDPLKQPVCGPTGAPLVMSAKQIAAKSALQHLLLRSMLGMLRRHKEPQGAAARTAVPTDDEAGAHPSPSPRKASTAPKPPPTDAPRSQRPHGAAPRREPKSARAAPPAPKAASGSIASNAAGGDHPKTARKPSKAEDQQVETAPADTCPPHDAGSQSANTDQATETVPSQATAAAATATCHASRAEWDSSRGRQRSGITRTSYSAGDGGCRSR
jgi:hypothetical protein